MATPKSVMAGPTGPALPGQPAKWPGHPRVPLSPKAWITGSNPVMTTWFVPYIPSPLEEEGCGDKVIPRR